ncbi:hypothetical protein HMPREF1989_00443, partial [Porphyromonas gingivalis F0566]
QGARNSLQSFLNSLHGLSPQPSTKVRILPISGKQKDFKK